MNEHCNMHAHRASKVCTLMHMKHILSTQAPEAGVRGARSMPGHAEDKANRIENEVRRVTCLVAYSYCSYGSYGSYCTVPVVLPYSCTHVYSTNIHMGIYCTYIHAVKHIKT